MRFCSSVDSKVALETMVLTMSCSEAEEALTIF